jgi:hypothetical protein
MIKILISTISLLSFSSSSAFTPSFNKATISRLHAGPSNMVELFEAKEIWDPIKKELNAVPVFSCSNEKGQPMQYGVEGSKVAFFFTDVYAAKVELEKSKEETKMDNLNLLPFPLGEVVEMAAKKSALIIPSEGSLMAAGAPKGINPLGQILPLFCYTELSQDRDDGSSLTPLFISKADAEEALKMALEGSGEDISSFELQIFPLTQAIQGAARSEGKKAYTFVPAADAIEFLRNLESFQ